MAGMFQSIPSSANHDGADVLAGPARRWQCSVVLADAAPPRYHGNANLKNNVSPRGVNPGASAATAHLLGRCTAAVIMSTGTTEPGYGGR